MKYLIKYEWGESSLMQDSIELETDDLIFTLDQLGRHRPNIEFTQIKQIK